MGPKKETDVEDSGDKDDGPVMKKPKFKDDLKVCFFLTSSSQSIDVYYEV